MPTQEPLNTDAPEAGKKDEGQVKMIFPSNRPTPAWLKVFTLSHAPRK